MLTFAVDFRLNAPPGAVFNATSDFQMGIPATPCLVDGDGVPRSKLVKENGFRKNVERPKPSIYDNGNYSTQTSK